MSDTKKYELSILVLEDMKPECKAQKEALQYAIEAMEKLIIFEDIVKKVIN